MTRIRLRKSEQKPFWAPCNSVFLLLCLFPLQERTGVQMIMIQDDPMPTGADKPLRITGDPHKVQVGLAWCAPLSFRFTLDFTHFMPSIFHFNLNASVFSDKTQAGLLLLFFLCRSHHCNLIAVSFIASPGTCGEAHPRQGPRRLQGWQGRLRIQNGGKQSGCKMGCFVFSPPFF